MTPASRNRALVIFLVGGAVNTFLLVITFDNKVVPSILAGFASMFIVAGLDYYIGDKTILRRVTAGLLAGFTIGASIWITTPSSLPWYVYPAVLALFVPIAHEIEHWLESKV